MLIASVLFITNFSNIIFPVTGRRNPTPALVLSDSEVESTDPVAYNSCRPLQSNIVFVYVGRWQFLQLQLPYLYRDLRKNGGVIDRVEFLMLTYDKNTYDKLVHFAEIANHILTDNVFSINYLGYIPNILKAKDNDGLLQALYLINEQAIKNPENRYFKFDDDIVYIHPKAFKNIIDMRSADCAIHYFNTAGSNYVCSWLHQKNGVYDGVNPNNFTFELKWQGDCGYKNVECAKFTLQTFLDFYKRSQLEKYFVFDVHQITGREQFSINGFLLQKNNNSEQFRHLLEKKKPNSDVTFLFEQFKHTPEPPCIVGNALIVHFGYDEVTKKLVKSGLVQPFYDLVEEAKDSFHLPSQLWEILDGYKKKGS